MDFIKSAVVYMKLYLNIDIYALNSALAIFLV